jgi:L-erythro-3,5-diaminohexanoate dehydrogenase
MTGGGAGRELAERLGVGRVLEPAGSLPQSATRLDAEGPCRPYEVEVEVERLCLDSTSHREIRAAAAGDADRMAARILEIAAGRGKMHNPVTDSGGVLLGRVAEVGDRILDAPALGERIVTLASLTLTPLRLRSITRLDPASPQLEVDGTAYVFDLAPWAALPGDLPTAAALDLFDVCSAASHVRELASGTRTICVLGGGHAGTLALAAARDTAPEATLVVVDLDRRAAERLVEVGLADLGVGADLRDPIGALDAVRAAGAGPADLTVVVVNSGGCEPAAILLTADEGTVLFFSMATSFAAVALTSDGLSARARIVVGTGYAPDRGAYALELVRRSPALAAAMGVPNGVPA